MIYRSNTSPLLRARKERGQHSAGGGLCLVVTPAGKYWRYSYTYNGTRKDASLGVYAPSKDNHTSLKAARCNLAKVKAMLADGIDPNQVKAKKNAESAAAKASARTDLEASQTFEAVANQWFSRHEQEIAHNISALYWSTPVIVVG
ncbi:MAG: Arm DNA-binding domain-containing protein [Mariprofundales bacterium]